MRGVRECDWRRYICEHPIMGIGIPADGVPLLRQALHRKHYTSREWPTHVWSRIAKRPDEATMIRRCTQFGDERLRMYNSFAVANCS